MHQKNTQETEQTFERNGWIRMDRQTPPEGVHFVMTSTKWKDRQFVVKKQWTAVEKRNNKTALHCLYWLELPPLPEDKE